MNFVKELKQRGMLHNIMPGTEEYLKENQTTAYLGIDPTADSLHIGHLAGIMMLKHFQESGHKPIVLIGGATGMIGDPSGKSKERNLLNYETLMHNQNAILKQLNKFLDFSDEKENNAELENNYNWMKEFSFLDFIRDIGKHMTVNYMMAKDSVKKRMSGKDEKEAEGLSFTEFSYQLVQGYDFLHLYKQYNCMLQMGGSDQWGNITTGTELIRRMLGGKAFAITCPLVTKADGTKFGKTEKGNIWLDPEKASPYEFYQFWINTSDEDAEKYIKIFTVIPVDEINSLIEEHLKEPYKRSLQKRLAEEVSCMVHNREEYNSAVEASQILFGKGTKESLEKLEEKTFKDVFAVVPHYEISTADLKKGIEPAELLSQKTQIFKSKGELRRTIKENGLSINQEKFTKEDQLIDNSFLIKNKYIVVRRGKKKYSIIMLTN